jgi:hypothetical protein
MACCRGATFGRVKPITLPGTNHTFTRRMDHGGLVTVGTGNCQLGMTTIGIEQFHAQKELAARSILIYGGWLCMGHE